MNFVSSATADPDLDEPCRQALDALLQPGESVWAVIRGRDGTVLVGTDRRLFVLAAECVPAQVHGWPYGELDDLRVVGEGILVRRRRDRQHLVTVPTRSVEREQTMQAVTIVELLIARAAHLGR